MSRRPFNPPQLSMIAHFAKGRLPQAPYTDLAARAKGDQTLPLLFRVPKSLGWRGFKIIFFMIYLWFEYDFHLWFFYGFKLWLWFFYGLDMFFLWFWIWFFNDFFMVFLVLRIWFSAKNSRNFRFFYDFARVSFSPKPFQQKIWFWKQNRKKIVNKS